MRKRRWIRAIALAVVWGYAAAIWTSMTHYLLGTPDAAPFAAVVIAATAFAWAARPRPAEVKREATTNAVEQAGQTG